MRIWKLKTTSPESKSIKIRKQENEEIQNLGVLVGLWDQLKYEDIKNLNEKDFVKGISPHITTGFDVIMLDKN